MAGSTPEVSTLIYINDLTDFVNPANDSEAAVAEITQKGFYYWDSTKWIKQSVDSNAWKLTGNAISSGQFLGTTNDLNLVLKRNNENKLEITSKGRLRLSSSNVFLGNTGNDTYTTAQDNIGIGTSNLSNLTTGTGNIALGERILSKLTSGQDNIVLGRMTGVGITTGAFNFLLGVQVGSGITTGRLNLAIGASSMQSITTETGNTAIEHGSMPFMTGNNNTALGTASMDLSGSSGDNNIALGYRSKLPNKVGNNQMSIGNSIYGLNINDGITTKRSCWNCCYGSY